LKFGTIDGYSKTNFSTTSQHIGKIDGIEKVGISYYDICNFGKIQIISIYMKSADIWFLPGDICKIPF
jgi:hypothetical protein